jgi:hypothetical protein
MSRFSSPVLDNIKIASPCPANWDEMYGDDRKRFCGECKLNVYNLSGMTKDEAESLITNAEGRLCVRIYRRADGSVITSDCPVGWEKIKQRTRFYATAVASLLMALFTGVLFVSLFSGIEKGGRLMGDLIPISTPTPYPLAGAIALPPRDANSNKVPKVTVDNPPVIRKTNDADLESDKFEVGKMRVLSGEKRVS